ncbi:MAG: fumarylacetoacetase [Methanobacteriota archaeon]|nr:MAG: fumarylacetoacetase [Euryarchaeota archaeon]
MTTDPNLKSFIDYSSKHPFPIQNLPYGVFSTDEKSPRVGVAIGDYILDLQLLEEKGFFQDILDEPIFSNPFLNSFMAKGKDVWSRVRKTVSDLLQDKPGELRDNPELRQNALIPQSNATMHLPFKVNEFTDFYASIYHATNVGTIIRGPENALQDNWLHLPVGYHGRASSVILSGQDIHRPKGQIRPGGHEVPFFSPSRFLDFEFEMGFVIGQGNELGRSIPISEALDHIFGLVILNDWSARDIQGWEYRPLGPFTAKNFATSISPWVVTIEALEPFRTEREKQVPEPMEYLKTGSDACFDITLQTFLQTQNMTEPAMIMQSNFKYLYWTIDQMLTHHTVTGCNMQTGDLCGTGTISGPTKESRACLLELTWRGKEPLELPDGETRRALEDYDTVIMTAYAENEHYRVGFGEVKTQILPALI